MVLLLVALSKLKLLVLDVFLNTVTVAAAPLLTTAISIFPSPSRSPTAKLYGLVVTVEIPVGMMVLAAAVGVVKDEVVKGPDVVTFLRMEIEPAPAVVL